MSITCNILMITPHNLRLVTRSLSRLEPEDDDDVIDDDRYR